MPSHNFSLSIQWKKNCFHLCALLTFKICKNMRDKISLLMYGNILNQICISLIFNLALNSSIIITYSIIIITTRISPDHYVRVIDILLLYYSIFSKCKLPGSKIGHLHFSVLAHCTIVLSFLG